MPRVVYEQTFVLMHALCGSQVIDCCDIRAQSKKAALTTLSVSLPVNKKTQLPPFSWNKNLPSTRKLRYSILSRDNEFTRLGRVKGRLGLGPWTGMKRK